MKLDQKLLLRTVLQKKKKFKFSLSVNYINSLLILSLINSVTGNRRLEVHRHGARQIISVHIFTGLYIRYDIDYSKGTSAV